MTQPFYDGERPESFELASPVVRTEFLLRTVNNHIEETKLSRNMVLFGSTLAVLSYGSEVIENINPVVTRLGMLGGAIMTIAALGAGARETVAYMRFMKGWK